MTQLQYAGPAQFANFHESDAARYSRTYPAYQQDEYYRNRASPQRTTYDNTTTARRATTPIVRGGGDYTSSEGINGSQTRPRPQPTRTRYWYCCTPGCPNPGPYIESIYENCVLGCGAPKCPECRREIVSIREPAPADGMNSRMRRS